MSTGSIYESYTNHRDVVLIRGEQNEDLAICGGFLTKIKLFKKFLCIADNGGICECKQCHLSNIFLILHNFILVLKSYIFCMCMKTMVAVVGCNTRGTSLNLTSSLQIGRAGSVFMRTIRQLCCTQKQEVAATNSKSVAVACRGGRSAVYFD